MLSPWKISYEYYSSSDERLRETLCTLGNGYFATRGAAPETPASKIHYPGTYIAGLYNKLPTKIAGRTVYNDDLVNCPNWLSLVFRIGEDDWIIPELCEMLYYHQELDMHRGMLTTAIQIQDKKGRVTTIETERFVHMANPHYAAMSYTITPENYEGWIVIQSALDGSVQNKGVARYKDLNSEHLLAHSMEALGKKSMYLAVKTSQSDTKICLASKLRILCGDTEIKPSREMLVKETKKIFQEFRISVHRRRRYRIEKIVSLFTSRDFKEKDPIIHAIRSVRHSPGFNTLLKSHKAAWMELWNKFDIQIKGDIFSQTLLRFHIFHLLQTASLHNSGIDAGLPARGLHGEPYRGHIFWDNVFVMHLFDTHAPEVSKALLMYRYRRLPQARRYAKESGYQGAMFPWQSASTGEEETQRIHLNPKSGKWGPDHSYIQRHISFAIAHNVWQYWNRTHDVDFLKSYGAEMILSIAQFGASLAKFNPKNKRYHVDGVMGPDEFHERYPGRSKAGIKDNSYTNLMLAWTLLKTKEVLKYLPVQQKSRLLKRLGLTKKDLNLWEDIGKKLNINISNEGIISQFDGYFKLKELNWSAYRVKYENIKRLDRILKSEGLSPDHYKVAKQADVLMALYLLPLYEIKTLFSMMGYTFVTEMLRKNYDYYISRTSHGSTLSKVVHCYIAHVLGRHEESWEWFVNILKSDIHDTQGGTSRESIHTGVMGGSIDIAMRAFAGIEILEDRIKIEPALPRSWENIKCKLLYRNHWIDLFIAKRYVTLLVRGKKKSSFTTPVEVQNKLHHIGVNKKRKIVLEAL